MRCFHNQLSRSSRSASFTSASCSCRTTSAGRAPSLSMSTSMDVKALIFSKIDGCTTWPNFHNCQACAGRFLLHSLPTQLSLSSYTLPMSNLKDKAFSDFSVQSELTKGNPNRPQCECATPNVYLICLQFCLSRKLQNRIPSPRSTVSETTNSAIHQYLQVDLVRSLSHQWRSKNSKPLLVSCACRISSFPILQLLCTCRAPTKMAPDPSTSGRFAWLHLLQLPGMKICKPSGENLSVNFVDNLGFGPGNVLFPSTTASQYIAHVFGMCHNLQCPLALGQEPDWLAREWVWYSGSSRGWMSFTAGWMFSPDLATESSRTRVLALATSFSSTNKKGTGTLKGFGRRVQVVDQDKALVPRSGPLHFGKGSRSLGCAKFTFCCGFQWAWTGGGAADDAPTWGSWSRGWKRRSALSHSRGWKRRSALAKRRFSSGFRRGNWMELVCGFKEEQTFQISNLSKQSFKENNVKSLNAKTWFQGSKTRFQIWSSKKSEQCKITRNHISLQRSLKNSKPRLLRMEDTEHDVPGNAKNIWMNTNDQSKTWHPSFFTDHRRLDTEGYPRKKFQP